MRFRTYCGVVGLILLSGATLATQARSAEQSASATNAGPNIEELKYVDGLKSMGLLYYANIVHSRLAGDTGDVIRAAEPLVGPRKTASEALAFIAKQPDQDSEPVWAMKLTVANSCYGSGMYSNAQEIYESFFKRFPDGPTEGLSTFYVTSGCQYAKMLLLTGQDSAALNVYRTALKGKKYMERSDRRRILAEMAELMVKIAATTAGDEQMALLKEAHKICEDLLWMQDVWFGKAIALLAHIKMLEGDSDGAQKLVNENWDILNQIDDMLKENPSLDLLKISPLANCHYVLGVFMQDEAEKLLAGGDKEKAVGLLIDRGTGKTKEGKDKRIPGALQHMTIVFTDYPSSIWASDARERSRKMLEMLKPHPDVGANPAGPIDK